MKKAQKTLMFLLFIFSFVLLPACGRIVRSSESGNSSGIVSLNEVGDSGENDVIIEEGLPVYNEEDFPVDKSYLEKVVLYPSTTLVDWVLYDVPDYSFALQYPNNWEVTQTPMVEEGDSQSANLLKFTNSIYELNFWFKEIDNTVADFEELIFDDQYYDHGKLFLGQTVTPAILLEGTKEVGIYYGEGNWVNVGDVSFVITLENTDRAGEGYALNTFDPVIRSEVEKIIASVAMLGVEYAPTIIKEVTDEAFCEVAVDDALDVFLCDFTETIKTGNLETLESIMGNPFSLGYWRSEWTSRPASEVIESLEEHSLPSNPANIIFTMDPDQFPEMFGASPGNMMGPDANVVAILYSKGWGEDGDGGVIIFITENLDGGLIWSGIVVGM